MQKKISSQRSLENVLIDVECQIESVRERIRDIEWRIDHGSDEDWDTRQKAVDKLRFLIGERAEVQKQLLSIMP
jgi:hypothetical protein